jgi:hypothetical protein
MSWDVSVLIQTFAQGFIVRIRLFKKVMECKTKNIVHIKI